MDHHPVSTWGIGAAAGRTLCLCCANPWSPYVVTFRRTFLPTCRIRADGDTLSRTPQGTSQRLHQRISPCAASPESAATVAVRGSWSTDILPLCAMDAVVSGRLAATRHREHRCRGTQLPPYHFGSARRRSASFHDTNGAATCTVSHGSSSVARQPLDRDAGGGTRGGQDAAPRCRWWSLPMIRAGAAYSP